MPHDFPDLSNFLRKGHRRFYGFTVSGWDNVEQLAWTHPERLVIELPSVDGLSTNARPVCEIAALDHELQHHTPGEIQQTRINTVPYCVDDT